MIKNKVVDIVMSAQKAVYLLTFRNEDNKCIHICKNMICENRTSLVARYQTS